MTLKTRPPTGNVPYPVVLLEGEEKAGKSWAAAVLSSSDKVGRTLWIDLGEGAADEYGVIPGVRYEVVEHDGTYQQVLAAVVEAKAIARAAKDAGELPVVLVIDSMTALWDGLKDWTTERAIARARKKGKSTADEDLRITTDLWNDAGSRYGKLSTHLLTFPGIVILTARGKQVVEMRDGQPVQGSTIHKVEGHKTLAYNATVWVRMSRTQPPMVIGARSVHAGVVPGKDEPLSITVDKPLLEWLIFDALKVDVGKADVRDLKPVTGGDLTADEQAAEDGKSPSTKPDRRPPTDTGEDFTVPEWAVAFRTRLEKADTAAACRDRWAEIFAAKESGEIRQSWADTLADEVKVRVESLQVAA